MSSKKLIAIVVGFFVLFLAALAVVFAVVFTSEGITVSSGSFSQSPSNAEDGVWRIFTDRANGNCRVDYTLDAEGLANLRAESSNSSGEMSLTLIQGDNEKTTDITGDFSGGIDTSGFEPGRIRLRLDCDGAEDVNVTVRWDG